MRAHSSHFVPMARVCTTKERIIHLCSMGAVATLLPNIDVSLAAAKCNVHFGIPADT